MGSAFGGRMPVIVLLCGRPCGVRGGPWELHHASKSGHHGSVRLLRRGSGPLGLTPHTHAVPVVPLGSGGA